MRLVTPETSAHWYGQDGTPRYDATLREARKENLLPSVTSITKLWPKGALEAWKIEQGIMAALTLPRYPNESLDAFAHRVVADGQSQVKNTAQWGTRFHGLCEVLHDGQNPQAPPDLQDHFEHYVQWFNSENCGVALCECNVVNLQKGYAGKLDLLMLTGRGRSLGDIKSRSVKNGKAVFYDEQPMQLVAYGQALPENERPDAYFSVIVNRDTPEPPYVKWYTDDEIIKAWLDFCCLRDLWYRVNRYTWNAPVEVAV